MAEVAQSVAPIALVVLVSLAGCSIISPGATQTANPVAVDGSTPTPTAAPNGTPTTTPTASPSSTETATPAPTTSPTPTLVSETGIRVVEINEDPEGRDKNNLNGEYIVLKNTGDAPIDLSGWRVKDDDGHVHTFQDGVTLKIGETLTLRSGSGTQTADVRFWWADQPVWDNNGDTISIFDHRGQEVYELNYT